MMNEQISSVMTKDPYSLERDASLSKVKELFETKRIHHIPIVEDNKLIGIITTHDLWKLNKPFEEYGNISVGSVMTKVLAKVSTYDKVGTAAELFLTNKFHALPVVDDNNTLVGIITAFDVLKYEFKKEYKDPILFKEIFDK